MEYATISSRALNYRRKIKTVSLDNMDPFCRYKGCYNNAEYLAFYDYDDFKYSIPHCERHEQWATETLSKTIKQYREENDLTHVSH